MNSNELRSFRKRLRTLRKVRGLNQKDLEEKIGKEENYITRVETGRIVPPTEVIAQIASVLEVSCADLFFTEGIDDSPEVLRSKIQRLIQTKDVKRLRKYYRLMLVSHEE